MTHPKHSENDKNSNTSNYDECLDDSLADIAHSCHDETTTTGHNNTNNKPEIAENMSDSADIEEKCNTQFTEGNIPEWRSNPIRLSNNEIAYIDPSRKRIVFEKLDEKTNQWIEQPKKIDYCDKVNTNQDFDHYIKFQMRQEQICELATEPVYGWLNTSKLFYNPKTDYFRVIDSDLREIYTISINSSNENVSDNNFKMLVEHIFDKFLFISDVVHMKKTNIFSAIKNCKLYQYSAETWQKLVELNGANEDENKEEMDDTFLLLDMSNILTNGMNKIILTANERYLIFPCNDRTWYLDLKWMALGETSFIFPKFVHASMSDNEYIHLLKENTSPIKITKIIPSYYNDALPQQSELDTMVPLCIWSVIIEFIRAYC